MIAGTPSFWWRKPGLAALGLSPLAALYGVVSGGRMRAARGFPAPVPVLCIGNFTLGGAGKTPTALALAATAKAMGLKPGFLSRGYGGSLKDAALVDPARHTAEEVGDEPLLLARAALTAVSRRRVEGVHLLADAGVDLILMDDGFQSGRILIDYALIVADARRGAGNGLVFPAGPLRAPLSAQLPKASALLVVGEGEAGVALAALMEAQGRPVFSAALKPVRDVGLKGARVLAFSGIADPEKFRRTLAEVGAEVALRRDFPDHAPLSDAQIIDLLKQAEAGGLMLVTTAKDAVRLAGREGPALQLLEKARVVEVEMALSEPEAPRAIIEAALSAGRSRLKR